LRRWAKNGGIDPTEINVRTTKWTIEAWLFTLYPNKQKEFIYRQGYSRDDGPFYQWKIKIRHLPFTEEDKIHMGRFVKGMIPD
jgi:hypothetical protein